MGIKVLIIAGEASGDLHGSHLVKAMLSLNPGLRFYGVGGDQMRKVGVKLLAHISDLAVVGITEVLFKLRTIYRVYRKLKHSLVSDPPSLIILIDYPDFNLLFARAAKKKNIPIVYYISPQIWAWRSGRIRKIARLIKKMIVIFPFEKEFYEKAHIDVAFVGHPLLDSVQSHLSRDEAFCQFALLPGVLTIGLLPGSRMSEVTRNLPPLLKAVPLISRQLNSVQFIIPAAPGLDSDKIKGMVSPEGPIVRVVEDNIYDVMQISDLLLVASGTATVEAAIMGTPMVVVYRVSPFSYLLGKLLINVKNIGMVNIIAKKTIVPELIQGDLNPKQIATTVLSILRDSSAREIMKKELVEVRKKLGNPGASLHAAHIITTLIHELGHDEQL
ncbi:MAG: lipid-A-disaccharide synthase [Pseudomonadota bacterium]